MGRGGASAGISLSVRLAGRSAVPEGFDFFDPVALTNDGRIYGTAYACGGGHCVPSVAVNQRGRTTIINEGLAYTANNSGTIGGSVVTDLENFIEQAALFTTGHPVELIPQLPGEYSSHVAQITDTGIAQVESINSTTFTSTFYLYKNEAATALNLEPEEQPTGVNHRGQISGRRLVLPDRAFRLDPRNGVKTVLNPLPSEPNSWGLGINSRGDVLGYSFVFGGLERIGVWRGEAFKTYFVEGTPEFPTVSNRLLWNEPGQIAIMFTSCRTDLNSYLVPAPGVRLKLADITDTLPAWTLMSAINERGDIVGTGGPQCFFADQAFILKRVSPAQVSSLQRRPFSSTRRSKFSPPQRRQCPQKIFSPSLTAWCGF